MNPGIFGFPDLIKGRIRRCRVADLGAGRDGDVAFATDCRAFDGAGTQESGGAGTGAHVTHNGTAWKITGTNVTAIA